MQLIPCLMLVPSGLVFCAFVALVSGRSSPHADQVEELLKSEKYAGRFSNNIAEDATLEVPDLIKKYQYPVEVHNIVTEDGYILQMHRIPHGRDKNNVPNQGKPVVFLMHGLLTSSADWVLMGPGSGLAYILAEEGFDVWMGNARGNYYSRSHLTLNPDSVRSTEFWDFSWDEIGFYDLPAMIDYILEQTGKSKLHYVGYCQGTTTFFVLAALRPEYAEKFISMHALAPMAYMDNNRNRFMRAISPYSKNIHRISSSIGTGEFTPNNNALGWAGQTECRNEATYQAICDNILFLIGGWNEAQLNTTMVPLKMANTPAGSSVMQFAHYGQSLSDSDFQRYDHGWIKNRRLYGSFSPPRYDLSRVQVPVFLHFAVNDDLAHVNDVMRLFTELPTPVGLFRINNEEFSHLDFLWGTEAKSIIYDRIVNLIWAVEG